MIVNSQGIKIEIDSNLEALFDSILLIHTVATMDLLAPTIKIVRKLTTNQIERMLSEKEEFHSRVNAILGTQDDFKKYYRTIYNLKEELIRKDLSLLGQVIAIIYRSKIGHDIPYEELYQVVEIDWTYRDLYPGGTQIHYEIFTKRDIRIRENGDDQK